jgi:hypothetical protein
MEMGWDGMTVCVRQLLILLIYVVCSIICWRGWNEITTVSKVAMVCPLTVIRFDIPSLAFNNIICGNSFKVDSF